ncbi:MAG TPA: 2-amino-4-hydroxy-6-hydroxymethyldihydropteridine diphosphokinase [Verrucomicrobiae bacterium]
MKPNPANLALVALGSNLGESHEILERALEKLEPLSAEPILLSDIFETDPVDCPPGSPNFLNAVAGLVPRPNETPESLLAALQRIETELGRTRTGLKNEARTIDLDLIAFGQEVRNTPDLTLPHPRAHTRRFVLEPLAQLAPKLVLPGQTKTVKELLKEL